MSIWKEIAGYENYEVSDQGQVRNKKTNRILKPGLVRDGYYRVNLYKNTKIISKYISRLVALAFIDNTKNLAEVNHINHIRTDNKVSNLEWVSSKDNKKDRLQYGKIVTILIDNNEFFTGKLRDASKYIGRTFSYLRNNISKYTTLDGRPVVILDLKVQHYAWK